MCGRYTLTTPGGRALAERFAVGDDFEPATLERYNVCPTEPIAIVAAEGDARVVHTVRWGLIPPWAHELGKGFQPINGKSETAADKAPFAELMARPERRCLVLADGWYEWLKAEKKGGDRIPFRYTIDDGGPFAFAGLWRRNRIAGELRAVGLHPHLRGQQRLRAGARPHAVRAGRARRGGGVAGRRGRRAARPRATPSAPPSRPANPAVNKAGVEGAELLTPPPPSEPAQLSLDT